MRKSVQNNNHRDGKADLPTSVKLRAFRCQDFADMPRKDRLAYAKALHAAIRADNQRRGQSYKPVWKTIGQCQSAYDRHMAEQRTRAPETNRQADIDLAVARFAADLDAIIANINHNAEAANFAVA